MNKHIIIATVFLILCMHGMAQEFGGNPATTKWKQINNEYTRVIFPAGTDSIAASIAAIAQKMAADSASIGGRSKKIFLLLQQDVVKSNGYIGLGPWRGEFFATAPQNPFDLGSQDWMSNLAIHEYRHVQQYNNFNVGLTKVVSTIFGQLGQALATSAAVPDWFFEGDAVWSETKHSTIGRGRLPLFFNDHKSIATSGKWYNWMKWRNGSYKDLVPSHYPTGYMLTAYGRHKFGENAWKHITQDAARYKSLFYPMQGAFKNNTGMQYNAFTRETFDYYRNQWKQERNIAEPNWITATQKNNVVDYKYPYPAMDGGIIALKRSYRDIPSIVHISPSGEEEKIATIDISYDDYYSYNNGWIVYTSLRPNSRWGNIEYSNIRIVSATNRTTSLITAKGKYLSPDISSDGQNLIAVFTDNRSPAMLHLLDLNGKVVAKATMDSGVYYSHPKFLPGDKSAIVCARYPDGKMAMLQWNFSVSSWETLIAPTHSTIGFPVVNKEHIYFSANAENSDALYALHLPTKAISVVANYTTGIYQGFANSDTAIGSYYTSKGQQLGSAKAENKTMNKLPVLKENYFGNELNSNIVNGSKENNITASKYRKTTGLLNFHSLVPYISESEFQLSLMGQNVLNTLQSELYYVHNTNESSNRIGYTGIYGQWLLQPIVNVSQTWNRSYPLNADTILRYNESNVGAGLRLPLNLTKGKQYRNLTLQSMFNYEEIKWKGIAERIASNGDFNYLDTRISYNGFSQQAKQQINPRWGQQLSVVYQNSLSSREATQTLARASLFVPGFAKTHSIVLQGAWQGRDTLLNYVYTNNFPFARGYTKLNYPRMWRFNANYHLPLFYPDWGFANIVYFLRVRANLFYDYTAIKSLRTGNTGSFRSTGTEIYFDTKWWNQQTVSFGIRYSRLLDNDAANRNPNQWEFVLPVSLYNL